MTNISLHTFIYFLEILTAMLVSIFTTFQKIGPLKSFWCTVGLQRAATPPRTLQSIWTKLSQRSQVCLPISTKSAPRTMLPTCYVPFPNWLRRLMKDWGVLTTCWTLWSLSVWQSLISNPVLMPARDCQAKPTKVIQPKRGSSWSVTKWQVWAKTTPHANQSNLSRSLLLLRPVGIANLWWSGQLFSWGLHLRGSEMTWARTQIQSWEGPSLALMSLIR